MYRDFGTPIVEGENVTLLQEFPQWKIQEERGALVFRDISSPGDSRYAFFPGVYQDFGVVSGTLEVEIKVRELWSGTFWAIQEENGVLVFRDMQSNGDFRYAFYPASGLQNL